MDTAIFANIEVGFDLILSLAFDEETEFGVDGFIMQRTPGLEFCLPPDERGVLIEWTDDDRRILATKVELSKNDIKIYSEERCYEFNISRLSEEDRNDIKLVLKKMNFDNSFEFDFR